MDIRRILIQKMQGTKLFHNNFGIGHYTSDPFRAEWERLASECNLESVEKAHQLWQQVVMEYMDFLRTGRSFPFAAEMQFMQRYIMNADSLEAVELDIDQMELERILSVEDDAFASRPTPKVQPPPSSPPLTGRAIKLVPVAELLKPYPLPPPPEPVRPKTHHSPADPNQFNNLSSLELIFLGYARLLQKMPLQLRLQTKRKITEIMDDAELKMENSQKSKPSK